MSPEDRRAALIDATVPLLHEHGMEVSTKRIARAAGVAEGTIFGVFPDKNSLLVAALVQALAPQPTVDALEAIDPALPLRERLARAAELVNRRFTENAQLMTAARKLILASDAHPTASENMIKSRRDLMDALTEVIRPDAALLRRPPAEVARLVLLFCGANSFGPYGDAHFDGADLVSLVLDGVLQPDKPHTGVTEQC
jgi:AcrR family transcriptional regulator